MTAGGAFLPLNDFPRSPFTSLAALAINYHPSHRWLRMCSYTVRQHGSSKRPGRSAAAAGAGGHFCRLIRALYC